MGSGQGPLDFVPIGHLAVLAGGKLIAFAVF
jgi:hypothetical protein